MFYLGLLSLNIQCSRDHGVSSYNGIDLWICGLTEDSVRSSGSQLGELFREMHISRHLFLHKEP